MKKALITGITGQDGSYLADFLLKKGYKVYGIVRRSSTFNRGRIDEMYTFHNEENFQLIYGDLCDSSSINKIINKVKPDEVYNLGAQSHVQISFDMPEYTTDTIALGTLRLLEALNGLDKDVKFYQASSSEMFGEVKETPQTEKTPFHPRSPYGCAKVFGYWITINFRESYNMFACNGILFNHESPKRGRNFVTRKITQAIAEIKKGEQDILHLGNLDAKRDWGYTPDYVEAMWLMLQQDKPEDYVIATGETHSVREFLEEAFKHAGFNIKSNGKKGVDEEYINIETNKPVVKISKQFFRPAEVDLLLGDPSKAKTNLNWEPKVKFKELVQKMVDADLELIEKYGGNAPF